MTTILSYALCTLADVKESLGITDTTRDNLITRKINQATEIIENYCQRRFKATDYTEYYDGTITDELVLRQRPINSITSLSSRSTTLNDNDFNTIDGDNYFYDSKSGIIRAVSTFYGRFDRWKVVYNAGYTTIPSDIQEACVTLSAYLVNQALSNQTSSDGTGETVGSVKRKTEGSRSIEYFDASESNSSANTSGSNSILEYLNLDDVLAPYANTIIVGL